jgi:hypothetical protein
MQQDVNVTSGIRIREYRGIRKEGKGENFPSQKWEGTLHSLWVLSPLPHVTWPDYDVFYCGSLPGTLRPLGY